MTACCRGFDTYLGIPYSDDMGQAARSPCPGEQRCGLAAIPSSEYKYTLEDDVHGTGERGRPSSAGWGSGGHTVCMRAAACRMLSDKTDSTPTVRPAGELGLRNLEDLNTNGPADLTPLVFQSGGVSSTPHCGTNKTGAYAKNTTIWEQPVDFSKREFLQRSLPVNIQHVRAALIASRRSSRVGFAVAPKYNNLQEARKSHPLTCFHCRRVHLRQTNGDSWVFQRPRLHRPQREGPVLPLHALLSRPHHRCSSTLAPPLPDPARQQVLRSERRLVPLPAGNQPQIQYASCEFQNTSLRGAFGDALAEVDWIVGNV